MAIVPLVAGNWKMNTTVQEAIQLASSMKDALDSISGVEKVVCPPFVSLVPVGQALQGTSIKLGAQNMYFQPRGAITGEVSPPMLVGLCQYVILGHSERRNILGETDDIVNRKVKAAISAGLRPILCVGESLQERQAGQAEQVVRSQVEAALEGVVDVTGLVVAYEPVWAIGTGEAADPATASEMMGGVIFRALATLYGEQVSREIPLLYGGSVTPDNVESFVKEPYIHGGLVGGASLKADQFLEIVRITARVKGQG